MQKEGLRIEVMRRGGWMMMDGEGMEEGYEKEESGRREEGGEEAEKGWSLCDSCAVFASAPSDLRQIFGQKGEGGG